MKITKRLIKQFEDEHTNQFENINPEWRNILYKLVNSHLNNVSWIALNKEGVHIGAYLAMIEELEKELIN